MASKLPKVFLLTLCVLVLMFGRRPEEHKPFEFGYKITSEEVKWAGATVFGADPETFEWIQHEGEYTSWGRDKNYVFYRNLAAPQSHGPSFELIPDDLSFAKDKNNVYFGRRVIEDSPWLANLKPNAWKIPLSTLAKSVKKLQGADAATFHHFEYGIFKDKNQVYRRDEVIEHADPETFVRLPSNVYGDDQHVFADGKLVEHADPKTYHKDPDTGDWMDARFVYVSRQRLEVDVDGEKIPINAAAWRKLGMYRLDDRFVFGPNQRLLRGADPATFENLGKSYGRDSTHVYWDGHLLESADPATFEVVAINYGKDANSVWRRREKLENSDPANFEVVPSPGWGERDIKYAIDKANVWYMTSRLTDACPRSFETLAKGLAKDSRNVWYAGRPLLGIHAESFRINDNMTVEDRDGVIRDERVPAFLR